MMLINFMLLIIFIFDIIKSYSQLCSNYIIFLICVILPKLISKCVRMVKKDIQIRIVTIPVEFLVSKIVSLLENEAILSKKAQDELEEINEELVSMKYFLKVADMRRPHIELRENLSGQLEGSSL